MPTGPWLTPPTQSVSVDETTDPNTPYTFSFATDFTSFADACETTTDVGIVTQDAPDLVPSSLWVVNPGGVVFWEIRHRPLTFDAAGFLTGHVVNYVPPTLPAGAISVEYEVPFPTLADRIGWLDSADASWTVYANQHLGGLAGERLYPAELTAEMRAAPGLLNDFHNGADLAGLPLLWSHTFPATLDQTLAVGPVSVDLASLAASTVRVLLLTYAEQISHDGSALIAPPPSPAGENRMCGGTVDLIDKNVGGTRVIHLDVTWTPGRYRYVYDQLPPLRQFPRDDFLGGAPRQGLRGGSTSRQSSARQGWRNTYR